MMFVDERLTAGERMFNMLPDLYIQSKVMKYLMNVRGVEMNRVQNIMDEILLQLSIDTATWSIEWWEQEYGIPKAPINTLEERRSIVKSQMQKSESSYAELIKKVADSYTGGEVETRYDNGIYVTFTSFYGVPSNLTAVRDSLERVIPAHLPLYFEYMYYFIKTIEELTIQELESKTLDKFSF